jgi:hypothetical protein
MIFKGIDNQTVEFKVINYQFPDTKTPGDYDSNWLNIYINVNSNMGNWQTVDPSLSTSEFQSLIDWFNDLSVNKYGQVFFMEPNLDFLCTKQGDEMKTIRICFDYESKPKSAKDINKKYFVDCLFTNNDLSEVAKELEKELAQYPSR